MLRLKSGPALNDRDRRRRTKQLGPGKTCQALSRHLQRSCRLFEPHLRVLLLKRRTFLTNSQAHKVRARRCAYGRRLFLFWSLPCSVSRKSGGPHRPGGQMRAITEASRTKCSRDRLNNSEKRRSFLCRLADCWRHHLSAAIQRNFTVCRPSPALNYGGVAVILSGGDCYIR
jgi:hypothetical protein